MESGVTVKVIDIFDTGSIERDISVDSRSAIILTTTRFRTVCLHRRHAADLSGLLEYYLHIGSKCQRDAHETSS